MEGSGRPKGERRLRVLLALFLVASATLVAGLSKGMTNNQANREAAFGQNKTGQIQADPEPHFLLVLPTETTQPDPTLVAVSLTEETTAETEIEAIPTSTRSLASPTPVPKVEAAAAPSVQPNRDQGVLNGQTQTVIATFYYCRRTVDKPDDGGGYCGHTASGVTVHPGTAACSRTLLGKSFIFADDPARLVFTCEDTGSGVGGGHVDIWYMTNSEGYESGLTGTRNIIWQD